MTGISPEEAQFAPVSLLDELSAIDIGEASSLHHVVREQCAQCLGATGCDGHVEHCVGERTDFDG